jgi:hypothetical protein
MGCYEWYFYHEFGRLDGLVDDETLTGNGSP